MFGHDDSGEQGRQIDAGHLGAVLAHVYLASTGQDGVHQFRYGRRILIASASRQRCRREDRLGATERALVRRILNVAAQVWGLQLKVTGWVWSWPTAPVSDDSRVTTVPASRAMKSSAATVTVWPWPVLLPWMS